MISLCDKFINVSSSKVKITGPNSFIRIRLLYFLLITYYIILLDRIYYITCNILAYSKYTWIISWKLSLFHLYFSFDYVINIIRINFITYNPKVINICSINWHTFIFWKNHELEQLLILTNLIDTTFLNWQGLTNIISNFLIFHANL